MNSIEFGQLCRPFNVAYRDLFGTIPVPSEYACTREQFLKALKQAVSEKKMIETYLLKRTYHNDGRLEEE
ncbi:hypothetical protein JRC49_09675 [Clostridiales bacterium FE2011]|nr:hypothetical protein JRC49_09675 [Clostridiales bacterium FE2011]